MQQLEEPKKKKKIAVFVLFEPYRRNKVGHIGCTRVTLVTVFILFFLLNRISFVVVLVSDCGTLVVAIT